MLAKYILLPLSLATLAVAQPKSVVEIVGELRSDVDTLKRQQPGAVQNQTPKIQNVEFVSGVANFKNASSISAAVLGVGKDNGGGLWLNNLAGKNVFVVEAGTAAGIVELRNANSEPRVRLNLQNNGNGGGVSTFFNQTGKPVATFGSSAGGGGGSWLSSSAGANVAFLGLSTEDKGMLSLANPNGQMFALIRNQANQNGGIVWTFNSKGKVAAALGNSAEEGGGVWVYGAEGDLVASISESKSKPGVGTMYIKQGQDYAELFDIAERAGLEPGSVVSAASTGGGIALSDRAYDPKVVGVLSGAGSLHPAMAVGSRSDGTLDHAVALAGQVYVRVSVEGGAIVPGDLLVASTTPGVAMRASDRTRAFGSVVGKAVERFEGPENGLVRMLVLNH
jgi:hypothetical protein